MALNQLQTKAESALAAVSSIDEIAHIRIITKAGGSRKATPAQAATLLAPLLAIDYSKLEEQIVPGEKWPDRNGDQQQVYVRTIIGRIPTTPWVVDPTLYDVKFGINAWQWNVVASQFVTNSGWTQTPAIACDSTGALSTLVRVADMAANAPYMIILKYTKR